MTKTRTVLTLAALTVTLAVAVVMKPANAGRIILEDLADQRTVSGIKIDSPENRLPIYKEMLREANLIIERNNVIIEIQEETIDIVSKDYEDLYKLTSIFADKLESLGVDIDMYLNDD